MSEKVTVKISKDVYDEIQSRISESDDEFTDVDSFIEFVLSEVLKEEEEEKRPIV